MNLDDLRAELRSRADGLDAHTTGRMAGIRAKAAASRRRKAGATVVAAVIAVGVIIGVPVITERSGDPQPVENAGPFPAEVNGDTRIAYEVGDKGDTSVTLEFTPEDTDFLLDFRCEDLTDRASGRTELSINGVDVGSPCEPGGNEPTRTLPLLGSVATATHVREFWDDQGVEAGESVEVTLDREYITEDEFHDRRRVYEQKMVELQERAQRADRAAADADTTTEKSNAQELAEQVAKARQSTDEAQNDLHELMDASVGSPEFLGVAAYDMTGERVEKGGIALPKERTVDGQTYELADDHDVVSGAGTASVDIPALDEPALVSYGSDGSVPGSIGRTRIDGSQLFLGGSSGVFIRTLAADRPHTVSVQKSADHPDATVFAAYYTLPGTDVDRESSKDTDEGQPPVRDDDTDTLSGSQAPPENESSPREFKEREDQRLEGLHKHTEKYLDIGGAGAASGPRLPERRGRTPTE